MLYKFNIKIYILILFIIYSGCEKNNQVKDISFWNNYIQRITEALSHNADEKTIISTIMFIDEIIKNEDNLNNSTIYYNKAKLLFKLQRYDDALDTLFQTDSSIYDYYKATLFFRLGKNDNAFIYLNKLIEKNAEIANDYYQLPFKERSFFNINAIIHESMLYSILSDETFESIINKTINMYQITQQDAILLLQDILMHEDIKNVKENILLSVWPDYYEIYDN